MQFLTLVPNAITRHIVTVAAGRIEKVERGPFAMRAWRFAIRDREEHWERFWRQPPPPGWHDLFGLLRRGEVAFEGDQRVLMSYLLYLKLALASLRKQ